MAYVKKSFKERFGKVQAELKAPKGQMNKFGGYKYRSCEDIVEALKPHLAEQNLIFKMEDEIVQVADRIYVKATVKVMDAVGEEMEAATAYAREAGQKKGMDEAQVTGAASSYARKYALCGLFGIDDGNDPDSMNRHEDRRPAQKPTKRWDKRPSDKQIEYLGKLYKEGGLSEEEVNKYLAEARSKSADEVSRVIEAAKARLAQKKAGEDEYIPTEEDVK